MENGLNRERGRVLLYLGEVTLIEQNFVFNRALV